MRKLSLTALLVAILSATVVLPGYVAAAGCDPASGCCGTGQSYVGQQLFAVPGGPSQVTYGPAPIPRQSTSAPKVDSTAGKARAAQTKTGPVIPVVPQFTSESLQVFTFSRTPFLGTLW
jgi:hypothetical protein